MEWTVRLDRFEGPLDLLLHLIKKNQLDIHDIPMALITAQYLEYLALMRSLNIDLASDYLVMAATLVHIKSRMLLPRPARSNEADELEQAEEDPRRELVRRLLEYQRYKEAAQGLVSRPMLGRDVFGRGRGNEEAANDTAHPGELLEANLFDLVEAFGRLLAARRWGEEALELDLERVSLADRIQQIADMLRERTSGLLFQELFPEGWSRRELVITFLALLEMVRLRMVKAQQASGFGAIMILPV